MGMNVPGEIRRLTEIAEPDVGLITISRGFISRAWEVWRGSGKKRESSSEG